MTGPAPTHSARHWWSKAAVTTLHVALDMASGVANRGVWQAGSVVEVFSVSEGRWLMALVMQVSKGSMSAWLADETRAMGLKDLTFSGLQLAVVGTHIGALPVGFRMVPSRSRLGQVSYLDVAQNRKLQTRELAWRYHIERHTGSCAGPGPWSGAPSAGSAPSSPRLPVHRSEAHPVRSVLCSAASLPRGVPVERAPPRCGGAHCGMFCPLRMKRLRPLANGSPNPHPARRQRFPQAVEGTQATGATVSVAVSQGLPPLAPPEEPPTLQPPAAAVQFADAVAQALARASAAGASQRSPLFHFPALVAMGFPPAQARRALETTGGDLSRAVECLCAARNGLGAPAARVVAAAYGSTEPASQAAPALPLAGHLDRSDGTLEPDLMDSAEDRLRAAEESAAAADELYEDAVAAALEQCTETMPGSPFRTATAQRCKGADASTDLYDEAVAAAWEKFNDTLPVPRAEAILDERMLDRDDSAEDNLDAPWDLLHGMSQSQPCATRQIWPEPLQDRHSAGKLETRVARRSLASVIGPLVKEAGEGAEAEAHSDIQYFDGPVELPCAFSQTQPEEPLPRGGRRAGNQTRHRAGRSRQAEVVEPLASAAKSECQSSVEEEALGEEALDVKEEEADTDVSHRIVGPDVATPNLLTGITPNLQASSTPNLYTSNPESPRRDFGLPGSQLEHLLAAAIDVPDLDLADLGAAATQPVDGARYDEASQGSLMWGPGDATDTQCRGEPPATAWQLSARY